MGIFRIYPSADTWITDVHPERTVDLRASGSNHGRSPSLNVFARKGDIISSSIELARTLVKFDLTELSGKIFDTQKIPSSSVSYYLRMVNMKHEDTVPTSYDVDVMPVSRSWDEGKGVDDDEFLDLGYANWENATSAVAWTTTGSDYITNFSASQHFDEGDENLEVNVTRFVNEWLTGSLIDNYGFLLKLTDTQESNDVNYYRKAFHSQETLYVDRMPYLEARWDDSVKDNRQNFFYDVDNSVFLYNFVRGELTTLPAPVVVTVKDSLIPSSASYTQTFTAAEITTGVFSASVNVSSTGSHSGTFYDIWTANGSPKMTGTLIPSVYTGSMGDITNQYRLAVRNLKRLYSTNEEARLVVAVRERDFVTHRGIISTASLEPDLQYIEKMYYSVVNAETGETVIPFGTGSIPYTKTSYNKDGNYFDLYMNALVPGFKYKLLFLLDVNNDVQVLDQDFTFKVR